MATEVEIHISEGANLLGKRTPTPEPQRETNMAETEGAGGEGAVVEAGTQTVPKISLIEVHNYKEGYSVRPYLPRQAIKVEVFPPQPQFPSMFRLVLKHGPFEWTVYKQYHEFRSLRAKLKLLRLRMKSHPAPLPELGTVRRRNQLAKVDAFIRVVVQDYKGLCATMEFLEVSRISFVHNLGEKMKEGHAKERSGGHHRAANCFGICRCFSSRRWFVLKDSYLAHIRHDNIIEGVLLFEQGMTVEGGLRQTGVMSGLRINTHTRELLMICGSQKRMRAWKDHVLRAARPWLETKRYNSFAPVREGSTVKWFVDGEGYMAAVADAIMAAKEEIFITDWMLSPHLYLKRDQLPLNPKWRLDNLLRKKAEGGVRVFIQIYREFGPTIDLGGEFASNELQHKNIVFFRHPEHFKQFLSLDYLLDTVLLWSHHEKMVVIDQSLAFLGGLDLAFGRWDNENHVLQDQGFPPEEVQTMEEKMLVRMEHTERRILRKVEEVATDVKGVCSAVGADCSPTDDHTTSGEEGIAFQKWAGKDYYNSFIREFVDLTKPLEDQMDRSTEHRMPWHDIACCVYGPAARDLGRHFIQRHNFTKRENDYPDSIPCLLPRRAFNEEDVHDTKHLSDLLQSLEPSASNATVQMLRSSGPWSVGLDDIHVEHSILNAYLDSIKHAEHFIYIENQFFISSIKNEVENGIVEALRKRIVRAHEERKKFRVIVVIPLMPNFAGEFGESTGSVLEAVIHWNYHTISRGENSLVERLVKEDHIPREEVCNFFSVYGLRAHGELGDKLVTEVLYVHSKCMIVDDRRTIIGSANVNDRSQLGDRDSEVAILVEDKEMVDSTMNGEPYSVGKFSHSLRCRLFKEHLGLLETQRPSPNPSINVADPVCDDFYHAWVKSAENNSKLFEEVFGGRAIPTDKARNYSEYNAYKQKPGVAGRDVDRAKELLTKIQGTLVQMPLHFLEEEDLLPDIDHKEFYAPEVLLK